MKIILADHFGICFGVRDAIVLAEKVAAKTSLTILGELVHNPIVREKLRAQGIRETSLDDLRPGSSASFMITAHGASDLRRNTWRATGANVFDGTCPLVQHAHEQLRQLVEAGFFPVVIGKAGHVEVRGLVEDFPGAVVIGGPDEIARLPRQDRYGVISQTTQPIEFVRSLVDEIRRAYPDSQVRFADTVCKPTKDRQAALQRLIAQADTIVVVGGRASNNTLQLVASCRAAGRRVIHIERPEELAAADFEKTNVAGVTAGTSTMRETVEAVCGRLREISSQIKQQDQRNLNP